jgi:putative PIN family toxin of toxin-antitoxin system
VRALLDANVLVSALLSRTGAPARLVTLWLDAAFELIVCPALLAEVESALAHRKLRARIEPADAERFVQLLSELAEMVPDPDRPPSVRSADPGDDYLLAVAAREQVPLVSGDNHLLALRERAPVFSPREFLDRLEP